MILKRDENRRKSYETVILLETSKETEEMTMPKRKPLADNCQYIRPEDAAAEIGCHVQYLRTKMAKKEWDLGRVEYAKKGGKNKYFIFRTKLDKFLGK